MSSCETEWDMQIEYDRLNQKESWFSRSCSEWESNTRMSVDSFQLKELGGEKRFERLAQYKKSADVFKGMPD